MAPCAVYGSLDDLVVATLADFAECGIDCLTKLALLEAAWGLASSLETQDAFALALSGAATTDAIRAQLEQLMESGLLVYDGTGYRLTSNPALGRTLSRLHAFWSDRDLHSRAAPLLRYRLA